MGLTAIRQLLKIGRPFNRLVTQFLAQLSTRCSVTRWKKALALGMASLLLTVTLQSCSATTTGPLANLRLENFRTQTADVPRLISTVVGEPKTLNYILAAESSSSDVLALMYSGLTTIDFNTSEIVPDLAESWDMSDDGQTIVFTLRENLTWSDGEPLTVDDVVFTYNELIFNPDITTNKRDFLRVGESGTLPEVTKVGDRKVQFKITESFAPFLRNTSLGIMPKHALEASVKETGENGLPKFLTMWGTDTNPPDIVCNGPYYMKRFLIGERIVLERNPNYWRTGPNGEAQPYIEQVVLPVVSSQDAEFVRFRSGDSDLMGVTPDSFSLMKQDEEQGRYTVYNGGPTTTRLFMAFNLNKGSLQGKPVVDPIKSVWFNEVKFRQAVAYAIDRDTMLNNIFKGLGEMQNSQIAPQSPYFKADAKSYDYNITAAKKLLQEAGFTYQGSQLIGPQGNPVEFTLQTNVGNKIREAAGVQITQNLSEIGIKVNFQPIDFNKLVENLDSTMDWEAIILGFGAGVEPNGSASLWQSSGNLHLFNQQFQGGKSMLPGQEVYDWEKEISDLYVKAAQELDEDKRKAMYFETQDLVQEYLPFIHLIGQYSMSAVRDTVENVQYSVLGGTLWNIHELTIDEGLTES
ncbi:MAG: ABC transporter substrate-binding protein [Cyanobacteria bacterium P01_D01_bin.105]